MQQPGKIRQSYFPHTQPQVGVGSETLSATLDLFQKATNGSKLALQEDDFLALPVNKAIMHQQSHCVGRVM